jgi:peptide/nickel transport system permease protein
VALKNASVPIVTVIGIGIALLISGGDHQTVICSGPGKHRRCRAKRDYPIAGLITVFAGAKVVVNLIIDISAPSSIRGSDTDMAVI